MKRQTTVADYRACFETLSEAVDFENQVLSIGREFLPECAIDVLDNDLVTAEYWDFLISQIEEEGSFPR